MNEHVANLPAVVVPQLPAYPVAGETLTILPVLSPAELVARRAELVEVVKNILVEGIDFGSIPGCGKKPSLFKPGAEKLNIYFGFYVKFDLLSEKEDWDKGLFAYKHKGVAYSKRDHSEVGEGVGACNSYETNYRYRNGKRSCPACNREGTIIKGKKEYGGGWICWSSNRDECCKAKFGEDDPSITEQVVGKIENENLCDYQNTCLKMSAKRAYIDATLKATGASEIFTQDIEDLPFDIRVIDVEEVKEARSQQKEARQQERDKRDGNDKLPTQAEVVAEKTADPKSVETVKDQSETTVTRKDPGPDASVQPATATSGTQNQSAATSADAGNKMPQKAQMDQLLSAANGNGWKPQQVQDFCCFAFGIDPKEFAKKFTWDNWEQSVKIVMRPENNGGVVTVGASGKPLPENLRWPKQTQGGK